MQVQVLVLVPVLEMVLEPVLDLDLQPEPEVLKPEL